MNDRDETRLRDMLDEASLVQQFVVGKSLSDLSNDALLAHAVVRALEIIGEAASRVSIETRSQFPDIDWKNIVGMRNRIVHDYNNVDLNIVWETSVLFIPELIRELEKNL
jgi:uncharacterized protein with HEPN domain